MLAKSMKAGFPKGVKLPADLKALCEFADENDGKVSGNFEFVTDGQFCATAWFDGDPEPAAQFAVFGQAGSGSLYALWLHSGSDAEIAPVVYLDSEGVGAKSSLRRSATSCFFSPSVTPTWAGIRR